MKIDHVGYLVNDILNSANSFEVLGYNRGEVIKDPIQKCFICFLRREIDEPKIELVQPFEENANMRKLLTKRGVSPYHLCYEVEDVQAIYSQLSETEGWLPIFAPVEAVAFGNRKITYFLNSETGFIEFLNKD